MLFSHYIWFIDFCFYPYYYLTFFIFSSITMHHKKSLFIFVFYVICTLRRYVKNIIQDIIFFLNYKNFHSAKLCVFKQFFYNIMVNLFIEHIFNQKIIYIARSTIHFKIEKYFNILYSRYHLDIPLWVQNNWFKLNYSVLEIRNYGSHCFNQYVCTYCV